MNDDVPVMRWRWQHTIAVIVSTLLWIALCWIGSVVVQSLWGWRWRFGL